MMSHLFKGLTFALVGRGLCGTARLSLCCWSLWRLGLFRGGGLTGTEIKIWEPLGWSSFIISFMHTDMEQC